jgi:hypothetical protein
LGMGPNIGPVRHDEKALTSLESWLDTFIWMCDTELTSLRQDSLWNKKVKWHHAETSKKLQIKMV